MSEPKSEDNKENNIKEINCEQCKKTVKENEAYIGAFNMQLKFYFCSHECFKTFSDPYPLYLKEIGPASHTENPEKVWELMMDVGEREVKFHVVLKDGKRYIKTPDPKLQMMIADYSHTNPEFVKMIYSLQ